MKRKILSIFLSLALAFTMIPAMSAAAFAETQEEDYLTFTSSGSTIISFAHWADGMDLQYSMDGGDTWEAATAATTISLADGKTVQFKGNAGDVFFHSNYLQFEIISEGNGTIAASGSVMSLFANKTKCMQYCCFRMFDGCDKLTSAPELPARISAQYCYHNMFSDCESLIKAPELPSTTVAYNCYSGMFAGCTSLKTAPKLPATVLAENCYDDMFSGCTCLKTAPELPATVLAEGCYKNMFYNCTSLESAPELPAKTLAKECYYSMFMLCTSLTSAPELPATILADECYSGMFAGCTGIRMYPSYSVNHASKWSIPEGATTAEDWNTEMFYLTRGEFREDPEPGIVLYQSKPNPVSTVKLSATKCTYNGKAKKPTVTVKSKSGKALTKGTAFAVAYKNNKKVGKATVTVKGIGDYKGTVTKTFRIVPKKPTVFKATPGTKKLTVKMGTKVAKTGGTIYQIAYKKKGTSKWKYTTTKYQTKTIKKLKKGKRYYVKVRAYKKVSGIKYTGAWSKTKLSKKIK